MGKSFKNAFCLLLSFVLLFSVGAHSKELDLWLLDIATSDYDDGVKEIAGIKRQISKFEKDHNREVRITSIDENSYSRLILGFLSSNIDVIEIRLEWLNDFINLEMIDTIKPHIDYHSYFDSYTQWFADRDYSVFPFTIDASVMVMDRDYLDRLYLTSPSQKYDIYDLNDFLIRLRQLYMSYGIRFEFVGMDRSKLYRYFFDNYNTDNGLDFIETFKNLLVNQNFTSQNHNYIFSRFLYDDNPYFFLITDFRKWGYFRNVTDKYSFYHIPSHQSYVTGTVLAVNKRSNNKESAMKLAQFLSGEDSQMFLMHNMSITVPFISVWQNEIFNNNEFIQACLEQLNKPPFFVQKRNFHTDVNTLLNEYLMDQRTKDSFAENFYSLLEAPESDYDEKKWFDMSEMVLFFILFSILMYIFLRNRNYNRLDASIIPIMLLIITIYILPLADSIYTLAVNKFSNTVSFQLLYNSFVNTLSISIIKIPITIIIGLILAWCALKLKTVERDFVKLFFFLPYLTSHNATAHIWKYIFNNAPVNLLEYSRFVSHLAVAVMDIWKTAGFTAVIFLIYWETIPKWYREVFNLESKSTFLYIKTVILPASRKPLFFILILHTINTLQMFDQTFVLGGVQGGSTRGFQTVVMLLYEYGFFRFEFSNAIYISAVYTVFVFVVLGILRKFAKGGEK